MTYYQQLKQHVNGYVEYWKEDFTLHDRNFFRKQRNWFVFGMRPTGTNIANLDDLEDYTDTELAKPRYELRIWIVKANKRFFVGRAGKVQELTMQEMERLIDSIE